MAGSSYPGMAQPFSMTHGPTNMSAGMRQEGMSRLFIYLKKKRISSMLLKELSSKKELII